MGGGGEEDEAVSDEDRLNREVAGEEGGVAAEEKVVEGWVGREGEPRGRDGVEGVELDGGGGVGVGENGMAMADWGCGGGGRRRRIFVNVNFFYQMGKKIHVVSSAYQTLTRGSQCHCLTINVQL